jgi:hypothetical protein
VLEVPYSPTAIHELVSAHVTLDSALEFAPAGSGICCRTQVLPFQPSAKEAVADALE